MIKCYCYVLPFFKKEKKNDVHIKRKGDEIMSSEAQKKAYKKYNEKKINFAVVYTPTDAMEGKRLKMYLTQTGQSANSYIKGLIKADLDSKGIEYVADDGTNTGDTE